jgi:hypothetical protein
MNITASQLRHAADIKDKIESLQSELSQLLGGEVRNGIQMLSAHVPRRGRRKMSAAARARIGAAQKARWAKLKAQRK